MSNSTKSSTAMPIHLVLGGARSGKSRYAEQQAQAVAANKVVYIATAQALDAEMHERIARHQTQRSNHWHTIEEPLALAAAIQQAQQQHPQAAILVDCLTLWLSNCLLHTNPSLWAQEREQLLTLLPTLSQPLYLVGNEVGAGIVPLGELSRRFVDENGWLHQAIAAIASDVTLVVAGIPMAVKRP